MTAAILLYGLLFILYFYVYTILHVPIHHFVFVFTTPRYSSDTRVASEIAAMDQWDVHSWLQEIDYHKRYAQSFIDNGYDQPSLCANLKDEDLDAIEVDEEDRNNLFEHVERLRHHSFARIPISYDSPMPNGSVSSRSAVNSNSDVGNSKPPVDNLGASQEPSVKSPDSLASVSHELPEHTSPSTSEIQLYSEALNPPSMHAPKKPPRSFKKQDKPAVPPRLPSSLSNGGLSRLQLKLKLKGELQKDHIVINKAPYVLVSEMFLKEFLVLNLVMCKWGLMLMVCK